MKDWEMPLCQKFRFAGSIAMNSIRKRPACCGRSFEHGVHLVHGKDFFGWVCNVHTHHWPLIFSGLNLRSYEGMRSALFLSRFADL